MTHPAVTVPRDAGLGTALDLMIAKGLSGLPVIGPDGEICGIVSEGDLLRRVELGTAETAEHRWWRFFTVPEDARAYSVANGRRVSDVMTDEPVTIDADASLADAAALMGERRIRCLPVLRDGALVGLLTRADFVKALRRYVGPGDDIPDPSDDEVRTRIVRELQGQGWGEEGTIRVSVSGGRVTLDGTVSHENMRRAAGVAAEVVRGVRSVENRLDVSHGETVMY